jgi:Cytidylate kinase-like family
MSFAENVSGCPEEVTGHAAERGELPKHGFQGNRAAPPHSGAIPASVTIAVSREAGSRGNTIGNRAGLKLGWPVYNQELLQYVAQEGSSRQSPADNLDAAASEWVEARLSQLRKELGGHTGMMDAARLVLSLAAEGGVVLIGRGAGFILPPESTLHVRIIAPSADRIAYMSQWLRLTREQAAEQVRLRDERRAEFLRAHFRRRPDEVHQYDLLLNSSLLGEEVCADLIVRAARAKIEARTRHTQSPPHLVPEPIE